LDKDSEVLIICNNLAERGDELGLDMIMRLQKGLTIRTIGNNPGIEFNIKPRDFRDFQELVTGFHIYLYTIKMPWGDGYNTAMLEAMRMGMAIVTVQNPSSPIVNGVNGLVGRDEQDILKHIKFLKDNPAEIKRLGQGAKETIKNHFSEAKFITAWRQVLEPARR
jgi:glycosyltransferase involved in cell wall biosynthesis